MTTKDYKREQEELEKTIQKMRDHLEAHKPIFRTALEYGLMYSKEEYEFSKHFDDKARMYRVGYAYGPYTVDAVYLDLYLGESDSIIRDVGPIIEEMREHPRYKFDRVADYIEMGWTGWRFDYTGGPKDGIKASLLIRVWFESSNKCKKVGTGEFEEKMRVECEE